MLSRPALSLMLLIAASLGCNNSISPRAEADQGAPPAAATSEGAALAELQRDFAARAECALEQTELQHHDEPLDGFVATAYASGCDYEAYFGLPCDEDCAWELLHFGELFPALRAFVAAGAEPTEVAEGRADEELHLPDEVLDTLSEEAAFGAAFDLFRAPAGDDGAPDAQEAAPSRTLLAVIAEGEQGAMDPPDGPPPEDAVFSGVQLIHVPPAEHLKPRIREALTPLRPDLARCLVDEGLQEPAEIHVFLNHRGQFIMARFAGESDGSHPCLSEVLTAADAVDGIREHVFLRISLDPAEAP